MHAFACGADSFDFIDHPMALGDFSKNAITPALGCFGRVVQKFVVFYIDKKLSCGAVRIHGSSHGHCIRFIFQAVVCFILNGVAGGFFLHISRHAATLNHKAVDHAMENGAVIMAVFDILQKIGG